MHNLKQGNRTVKPRYGPNNSLALNSILNKPENLKSTVIIKKQPDRGLGLAKTQSNFVLREKRLIPRAVMTPTIRDSPNAKTVPNFFKPNQTNPDAFRGSSQNLYASQMSTGSIPSQDYAQTMPPRPQSGDPNRGSKKCKCRDLR